MATILLSLPLAAQQPQAPLPKVIRASVPLYPELARQTRIQGTVTLRVSTDGTLVSAVGAGSGHPILMEAATENVKTWEFKPYAPTSFEVTLHYRLLNYKCDSECKCEGVADQRGSERGYSDDLRSRGDHKPTKDDMGAFRPPTENLVPAVTGERKCSLVLVFLLAFSHSLCPRVLGACSSRASSPQHVKDSIDSWARENYNRALDLVLKDRCTGSKDARWISCIRIVPGHPAELEYSLSVEKRNDGTIFAQITRPKTQSVYTQLCRRKKDHPRASVGDLTRLIDLESQAGDQRSFPGLVHLADDFEKIQFSPVLSDEITMDATQYLFRVTSFSGDQMELTLRGPGSAAPHQSQILVQWAESVREMLAGAFH